MKIGLSQDLIVEKRLLFFSTASMYLHFIQKKSHYPADQDLFMACGTIMGVTIPRLYTSWIATKLTVNGIDVSEIRPVTTKKMITMTEFKSIIKERTSDWYSPDDPEQAEEVRQQKDRFIWETLL